MLFVITDPICFAIAGAKSLVLISSLDVQVQEYNTINKEMQKSSVIDSIHGTQNASFAPMSEPPPQSSSYTMFTLIIVFSEKKHLHNCLWTPRAVPM